MEYVKKFLQKSTIKLIECYQYALSPFFGYGCSFYPSCSAYTKTAIQRYGVLKGCLFGITRLAKCHPWHPGGVDPVPERNPERRL